MRRFILLFLVGACVLLAARTGSRSTNKTATATETATETEPATETETEAANATATATATTPPIPRAPSSPTRRRLTLLARLAFAVTHLPPVPESTPAEDPELLRAIFARATEEYEDRLYAEAASDFLAAYEVKSSSALLFNAAVCLEKLGDCAGASELFERYLDDPEARDRDAVIARLETCRGGASVAH